MPTSSQALILHTRPGEKSETVLKTRDIIMKEPAPYTVASIYDLNGCTPLSKTTVDDGNAVKFLGKESAQLFKYHQLPKGYTSVLAFDESRETFNWHVLGGGGVDAEESHTTQPIEITLHNHGYATGGFRPASTMDICKQDGAGTVKIVNEMMYEQLVGLGFRKSDFTIIDEEGRERPGDRDIKTPAISTQRSVTARIESSFIPNETTESSERSAVNTTKEVTIKKTPSICDVISDECEFLDIDDIDDIDEYNRIKPSIYMVKHIPKSRPTAAILSLRDNEGSFHAEVKFFIETQIGVRLKSVQYDPLHIRSDKPDMRSRWIVDFNSVDDLEKVVKKGLIIGKDKIIIYKFDEIMRREVSSFRFFKSVLEAKKKLRASKSQGGTTKKVSAVTCGKTFKTVKSVKW